MNRIFCFSALIIAGLTACSSPHKHSASSEVIYPPSLGRTPACGGSDPQGLQVHGDVELAKSLVDAKLVCQIGDIRSEGLLHEYAQYRCIGSPTYLSLETFGQNRTIGSVHPGEAGSFALQATNVSNVSLSRGRWETFASTEVIKCVRADASSNSGTVLKLSDFECQKEVHGALHSAFIADVRENGKKVNVSFPMDKVDFVLQEPSPGIYQASSLNINGRALMGTGTAKVEKTETGCNVISKKASILK